MVMWLARLWLGIKWIFHWRAPFASGNAGLRCAALMCLAALPALMAPQPAVANSAVANTNSGVDVLAFSPARLLEQKQQQQRHYRLVLSELKRTGATTYGEQEKRLEGELWRRYWAVDTAFSLAEVSDYFARQFQPLTLLYQCQGLDCGSSHFWANEIFDNGRLVGREANQRYWAALTPLADGRNRVWVAYVVQRGSGQVYVALDRFDTAEEVSLQLVSHDQIATALRQNAGWLPGLMINDGMLDTQASANLISVLTELAAADKRRLYLMVHCYDASQMSDNLRCSERLAKQLRVATFDGRTELNILGQGALTAAPDSSLDPQLRYVFWPQR